MSILDLRIDFSAVEQPVCEICRKHVQFYSPTCAQCGKAFHHPECGMHILDLMGDEVAICNHCLSGPRENPWSDGWTED